MSSTLLLLCAAITLLYGALYIMLFLTQGKSEPCLLPVIIPFLDPAIGIAKDKVYYLVGLRYDVPLPLS